LQFLEVILEPFVAEVQNDAQSGEAAPQGRGEAQQGKRRQSDQNGIDFLCFNDPDGRLERWPDPEVLKIGENRALDERVGQATQG